MPGYIIILHKCTKIIIQDYTVPEIWHMMDVIIFHFGLSFALLQPKKLKFQKKMKKKKKKKPGNIILHKCTKNHDHMLYYS